MRISFLYVTVAFQVLSPLSDHVFKIFRHHRYRFRTSTYFAITVLNK